MASDSLLLIARGVGYAWAKLTTRDVCANGQGKALQLERALSVQSLLSFFFLPSFFHRMVRSRSAASALQWEAQRFRPTSDALE